MIIKIRSVFLACLLNDLQLNITVVMRMTAAAVIGCLDEFQMGKDDFDCYIERMEQFFIVNAVPDEKKVTVFLTTIGGPAYELLRNLISHVTPKDKSLSEL